MLAAGAAHADDKVTLQLKWVTQAQFAGYYVAKDKGFYKDGRSRRDDQAGRPGRRARAGARRRRRRRGRRLDAGGAGGAREGRADGQHRAAVQAFGPELTCRADTGIKKPEDLKGQTLGVWFYGNEYPFLNWMGKLKFQTDGSPAASRW